nr:putative oxygenase MesX [Brevibacterium sp. UCMA 11754]
MAAEATYRPTLKRQDFSETPIAYDRAERSQLAIKQESTRRRLSSTTPGNARTVGRQLSHSSCMSHRRRIDDADTIAHFDRRQPAEAVMARTA